MTEILLFGAGASIEANVPGAYRMTNAIADRFRQDPLLRKHAHVLSFVIGGLLFEAGKNNTDPLKGEINVEDLFNAIQLLAERNSLEAAPFVGSWHPMIDEFDKIYPSRSDTSRLNRIIYESVSGAIRRAFEERPSSFEADRIDDALTKVIKQALAELLKNHSSSIHSREVGRAVERYVKEVAEKWSNKLRSPSLASSSELDRELARLMDDRQAQPGEGRIFHRTNSYMISTLKDLVWIDNSGRVQYLAPLLNLLQRQKEVTVASLNYDNGVELLANSQSVLCSTGIEQWSAKGDFVNPEQGMFVLKLHGSIDWVWMENQVTADRPMPHSVIRRVERSEAEQKGMRPALIFGGRNKLTAEGPFLDLLRAFQRELFRAKALTIVGYSFRDPHINVYISQWLNRNPENILQIINGPRFEEQAATFEYGQALLRVRQASPQRIRIFPQYAGEGLQTLYGPFENLSANSPAHDVRPGEALGERYQDH